MAESVTSESCVFCAVAAGRAEASTVHEDETVVVFMDLHPVTRGHLLVVPRTHCVGLEDLDPDIGAHVWAVGHRMARALRRSSLRPEGMNVLLCDGEVAFQSVFHLHLHVIPRYTGDGWTSFEDEAVPRDRALLDEDARLIREVLAGVPPRQFGTVELDVPADFDAPLSEDERDAWSEPARHGPCVMQYVGVDLAWSARARTGLAVLDETGRLVASTSVVTDADVAAFVHAHAPGDVVAAIDAPLVVPNATGRRDCEAEVGRLFGAYDAGAHPANRSRPYFDPPRAEVLAERMGWSVDPALRPAPGRSVAIEVYPHPAMVSLFGLGRVIPYKAKPGRDVPALKAAFAVLLDNLERACDDVLRLTGSPRWAELRAVAAGATRKSQLGAIEDEVDAILCAYLAWLWGQGDPRMEVLGDAARGYIVVPGRPTAAPWRAGRDRLSRG